MSERISRKGSVTGHRINKDGSESWRVWWYDSEGARRSKRVAGTRREAERRLDAYMREAEEERVGLRAKHQVKAPTMSELAVRAEEEVMPLRQRPRQRIQTLSILARWWDPAFGSQPINTITAADVQKVLAYMRKVGRAPATCNRALAALSVVMEAAKGWGFILHNPCHGLRLREGRKIPRYLSATEAKSVIEMASDKWRGFFAMAIYTGLRLGELGALRWRDLDLDRGLVIVRDSRDGDGTKSGHHRSVPLHDALLPLLPEPGHPDHLMFQGGKRRGAREANPMLDKVVAPRKALLAALSAAGIERHLSFHDLRHTFATLCVDAGVSPRTLQQWLGHSSMTMTMRYLHVTGDQKGSMSKLKLE